MKVLGFLAVAGVLVGCTPSATPVKTTSPLFATAMTTTTGAETSLEVQPEPVALSTAEEPAGPDPIPTACVGEQSIKEGRACLPPGGFVKKLCGAAYPDVALAMFSKGTPWTRVWLAGDVEAWSASGGFTSRTQLAFDEEVLVLSRHAAPTTGGIVMSGNTSFDVLRWDGSCVSVMEGELTTKRPPMPKPATMPWNRLEDGTKRALLTAKPVKASHSALEKACTGEKEACKNAEESFSDAIAHAVRSGSTTLPTPTHRP